MTTPSRLTIGNKALAAEHGYGAQLGVFSSGVRIRYYREPSRLVCVATFRPDDEDENCLWYGFSIYRGEPAGFRAAKSQIRGTAVARLYKRPRSLRLPENEDERSAFIRAHLRHSYDEVAVRA
jgi:hypothetical protein